MGSAVIYGILYRKTKFLVRAGQELDSEHEGFNARGKVCRCAG